MISVVLEGFPADLNLPEDRIFPLTDGSNGLRIAKRDPDFDPNGKSIEELELHASQAKEFYAFVDSGQTRTIADSGLVVKIFRFTGIEPREKK